MFCDKNKLKGVGVEMKQINTFSIVAYDPNSGEFGIAVQSKFLACAALVSWAKGGVGAIATQSLANLDYGDVGLKLLEKGYSAEKVLETLLALDDDPSCRQVGIVDRNGNAAAYTGDACAPWCGHITGENYTCQGNILVGEETVIKMSEDFEKNTHLLLAERLVSALAAGQQAGGDSRGQQAAGLLIVKENGSYGGYTDKVIDLRVDDDPKPIDKLSRLLSLHRIYFGETKPEDILNIDQAVCKKMQIALAHRSFYKGEIHGQYDEATKKAFCDFCHFENFEERYFEGDRIDQVVLDYLCAV